jgi:cell division protein FtsL
MGLPALAPKSKPRSRAQRNERALANARAVQRVGASESPASRTAPAPARRKSGRVATAEAKTARSGRSSLATEAKTTRRSGAKAATTGAQPARTSRSSPATARSHAPTARAATAAATAAAAPATAPARRAKPNAPKPRRAPAPAQSPVARVLNSRGMPLLDRTLRGPAWVVMLGALLAGIVFLNVSVLELNRGIARTDTKSAQLERVNSALRARVAKLDSGERIQELAAARGFVMPQPGDVTYVRERASNPALAAERIAPPADTQTTSTSTSATVPTTASSSLTSSTTPSTTTTVP